jgi:hypothetical protein
LNAHKKTKSRTPAAVVADNAQNERDKFRLSMVGICHPSECPSLW